MQGTRRRWVVWVACAVVFTQQGSPGAAAQRPVAHEAAPGGAPAAAPDPAPVSIRINAVVTDRRGRPILDLKPADFELQDNGVDQKLESAVLKTMADPGASPSAILSAEDE